ncbi:MAG: hypothetical protein Q4F81_02385 [Eubacteriales bacterium]|nr:hypothetical protein [Eubacteriales bacterium]
MFGGEQKRVSIRFINPLLDTVVERFGFGAETFYKPDDDTHFIATTDVEISDQFYGCSPMVGMTVSVAVAVEESLK